MTGREGGRVRVTPGAIIRAHVVACVSHTNAGPSQEQDLCIPAIQVQVDGYSSACSSARVDAGLKARAAHTGHLPRGLVTRNSDFPFLRYRAPEELVWVLLRHVGLGETPAKLRVPEHRWNDRGRRCMSHNK